MQNKRILLSVLIVSSFGCIMHASLPNKKAVIGARVFGIWNRVKSESDTKNKVTIGVIAPKVQLGILDRTAPRI